MGYRVVLGTGIRRAAKILTVSHAAKDDIVGQFPYAGSKVLVAHEGVDTSFLQKVPGGKSLVDVPYFLYVGNAYPHKNLEFLIDAFAAYIQQSTHPANLVLVGNDDFFYRRLKEYAAHRNLTGHVQFFGHAGDSDLSLLYRYATALVFPSLAEGFGLPALEALSFGCPVIASDIPVFREILPGGTLFLDPFATKPWSDAFGHAVQKHKKGAENNGDETIRKHLKKFSWTVLARETLKAYEDSVGVR